MGDSMELKFIKIILHNIKVLALVLVMHVLIMY